MNSFWGTYFAIKAASGDFETPKMRALRRQKEWSTYKSTTKALLIMWWLFKLCIAIILLIACASTGGWILFPVPLICGLVTLSRPPFKAKPSKNKFLRHMQEYSDDVLKLSKMDIKDQIKFMPKTTIAIWLVSLILTILIAWFIISFFV